MADENARKQVLVVDDEENLLHLYKEELELDGFEVVTASNARDAIRIVEQKPPDVVVMDIRMPGMDGIEAMGRMLNKRRDLRIILNTAYNCYKDDFRTWPAVAYIVKSSDLRELRRTVRQLAAPAASLVAAAS